MFLFVTCTDETKIGQKLLEKMGWSKGKGLGREEQGDLEPVRLKYKNDAEGVGYKVKDDQWIAHRDEFNAILGELNGADAPTEIPESIPVKSLEVRSKSSKSRVHYHKFTRGKDLSRYSAKDLACILGKRAGDGVKQSETSENQAEEIEKVGEENEKEETSDVEHSHGVTTIRKGNINEYFASKMAALKGRQWTPMEKTVNDTEEAAEDSSDGHCEKRVRFNEELNVVKEFCSKKKVSDITDDQAIETKYELEEEPSKKKKKSKKRKIKEMSLENGEAVILESIGQEEGVGTSEAVPEEDPTSLPKSKSKKKKKKDREAEGILEREEPIEPLMGTEDQLAGGEREAESTADQVKKSKKKKKKKSRQEGAQSAAEDVMEDPAASAIIVQGVDKKRSKKRKREEEGEEQPTESSRNGDDQKDLSSSSNGERQAEKEDSSNRIAPESSLSTTLTSSKYAQPNLTHLEGSTINPGKLKKAVKKYHQADFDRFKGSNLYSIAGYGHSNWPFHDVC